MCILKNTHFYFEYKSVDISFLCKQIINENKWNNKISKKYNSEKGEESC